MIYLCSSEKMKIPVLNSVKAIEHQYKTGEEPVLVMCSDMNAYICKYMRSTAASYKLVSELIGSEMARIWQLNSPETAIVSIKPDHWNGLRSSHSMTAPAFGSKKKMGVIDITPATIGEIEDIPLTFAQLLHIALFDFWMANEDRNANNANLMYDIVKHLFVPIDYGCVFNTSTYDYPLSQLTMTDSILSSELFEALLSHHRTSLPAIIADLDRAYALNVGRCMERASKIIDLIPVEWNVPREVIAKKVSELLDPDWHDHVWLNFMECLNEIISLCPIR